MQVVGEKRCDDVSAVCWCAMTACNLKHHDLLMVCLNRADTVAALC
jgi:hypothetical protein